MGINIFLGVSMASYRLDLYNYLYEHFNCDIYFLYENPENVAFDVNELWHKARFPQQYIKHKKILGRRISTGLRSLFNRNKPEVVFVPEFSLTTIAVLFVRWIFRFKFKIVSICDDSIDAITGNDFTKAHALARKLIVPHLDNLIIPDSRARDWYQKNYRKGIWFPIISNEERMIKECFNYNNSSKAEGVLFVGRLVDVKNLTTLISAFARIKHKTTLTIVGDGECRQELEQQANDLGVHVEFVGAKHGKELYSYYTSSNVFVLPSYREPFGAVTNEALLGGCYCLVSEVAGSACLIEKGINGDTFQPYDVDRLAMLIDEYLDKAEKNLTRKNMMSTKFEEHLRYTLNQI